MWVRGCDRHVVVGIMEDSVEAQEVDTFETPPGNDPLNPVWHKKSKFTLEVPKSADGTPAMLSVLVKRKKKLLGQVQIPLNVDGQGTGTGANANAGLVGRTLQWFKLSKPGSMERVGDVQLMIEVGQVVSSKQRDEELGDGLV